MLGRIPVGRLNPRQHNVNCSQSGVEAQLAALYEWAEGEQGVVLKSSGRQFIVRGVWVACHGTCLYIQYMHMCGAGIICQAVDLHLCRWCRKLCRCVVT